MMMGEEYNDAKIKEKINESFPSIGEKIWKNLTKLNLLSESQPNLL